MDKLPIGTTVRHLLEGYEGVILGTTKMPNLFENPESEWEYRIDIGQKAKKIAAPSNLALAGASMHLDKVDDVLNGSIILTPHEIIEVARHAHDAYQLDVALQLADKAFSECPTSQNIASTLSSILRDLKRPKEAIQVAETFDKIGSKPLLTTMAAAYCDLEEYEKSYRLVNRVIAMSNGRGGKEIMAVRARLKSIKPSLFVEKPQVNAFESKKHVDVVAAVMCEGNSVYCFRKGEGKFQYLSDKFEFPGGKVEPDEDKKSALLREIKEELDVDIEIREEILTVNHEYPDFSLTMTCFRCMVEEPNFTLNEHTEVRLVEVEKLLDIEWLAADLPVVERLMESHNVRSD